MTEARSRFIVQAFRAKGRSLEAEQPQEAHDEPHALRKIERLAAGKAGAVALRQDSDLDDGAVDPPIVLRIIGRVPDVFLDSLPF